MAQPQPKATPALEELAQAKVNLTLEVLGRRPDGYHELDSIVAFADFGDRLWLYPGEPPRVGVTGPFAREITGDNLAARALALTAEAAPHFTLGRIEIDKRIPVAAGLGGGSADAAAVLRLLARANADEPIQPDWQTLALTLGSDVPATFASCSCRMQGRGERLSPLPYAIDVPAVLVNPSIPVPPNKTARVFSELSAPPLTSVPDHGVGHFASGRNDLESAASAVMPEIAQLLARLRACNGARWARLSGAGPTAFAVFDSRAQAEQAASKLSRDQSAWWVTAVTLS